MSARERLAEALRNPGLVGLRTEEADELIADYARELAEEIRSERDAMRREGKDPRITVTQDTLDVMSYAANLIDPQGHEGERPAGSEETSA